MLWLEHPAQALADPHENVSAFVRSRSLLVFIYLDDIIIFGKNPDALGRHLDLALRDLNEAGMQINAEKSVLQAVRELQHLGFTINLKEGYLSVPTEKLKSVENNWASWLPTSICPRERWPQFWALSAVFWPQCLFSERSRTTCWLS